MPCPMRSEGEAVLTHGSEKSGLGTISGASPEAPTEPAWCQSHCPPPNTASGNDCHGNKHQGVCIKKISSDPAPVCVH